jgi:uncharacterized delta-60 repeat protein
VASLTVIDPVIVVQPADQTVNSGQNASFTVKASGTAPLGYQWRRTGMTLTGATNASLNLTNVQAGDAGIYQVVVSNGHSSVTSGVAVLKVYLTDLAFADSFNPGANSGAYTLAFQPDGKILVGGGFSTLGGQSRNCIGRLNADGTVDATFNPGTNSHVFAVFSLALQADRKILVGGNFWELGGQSRPSIGRLNPDGTPDPTFNPGAGGAVYSLAVQADGKILVGGNFTTLGGLSRTNIGRLNADGTVDATFNPGANNFVYSLALQADGKILVGGVFSTLGGQSRSNIGRLNADGTVDAAFNPGSIWASSCVNSLALQADGKILVGGQFTMLGGQNRSNIGRLNADGTVDATFNPGADNAVNSLALQADRKILVGGAFSTLGGQSRSNIGRLNADGTVDATFNPGANNYVYSIALQPDGKILVGGSFYTLGGQSRSGIGRLVNTDPAVEGVSFDGASVTWLRGGTAPEFSRATLDAWSGSSWIPKANLTRIASGWQGANLALSPSSPIRVRGFMQGGYWNASSGIEEVISGVAAITSQPSSRTNNAGTVATFSVSVAGTAPLQYQWSKGGILLADAANISGSSSSTLTLSNVCGGDVGSYFVVISNSFGSVTSSVASLTLLAPPSIVTQPQSISVLLGSNANFSLTANGTGPLIYQWKRNGSPLADGGTVSGSQTASLTLGSLTLGDAGSYSVVVTNQAGSVTSDAAILRVLAMPGIRNIANTDGVVTISCSSVLGLSYTLEYKDALDAPGWTPILPTVHGTGDTIFLTDSNAPAGMRFYHIRVE